MTAEQLGGAPVNTQSQWYEKVLERLRRKDKWYIGGGNKLIWSPAFPSYLDRLGLWDNASFYDLKIEPGYTFHVFHEGMLVRFDQVDREWTPASLRSRWKSSFLEMIEEKIILPNDFLGEKVHFINHSSEPCSLQVVLWTAQKNEGDPTHESTSFIRQEPDRILFQKQLVKGSRTPITIYGTMVLGNARSFQVDGSEFTGITPEWELTPFYETLSKNGLSNQIHTQGIHTRGLMYFALERSITLEPKSAQSIQFGWSFDTDREKSHKSSYAINSDLVEASTTSWNQFFRKVPYFTCDDPHIHGYYPYRWYGLRLFQIDSGEGTMRYPAICEGLEYFRVFITYSAQCHILEGRWNKDPSIAQGSLLNFLHNQREDGSFAGHIYLNGVQQNGFYHADWGRVVQGLHRHHPDMGFLKEIYPGLCRYMEYFERERDREQCGLYDVVDQYETGQEYMSRYLAVDERADRYGWINTIRLKGVDATVYIYNLKKALGWIADRIGLIRESEQWQEKAKHTRKAVLQWMWDPQQEFFFDVDPKTMTKTTPKSAVCFYPYMTDIVDREHISGLKRNLFDSTSFWSPYPITTVSMDDPFYDAYARWKGKRHNCPWNGRVWPMTNSHIVDMLGFCARRFDDPLLRDKTVELLRKFITMMHFDGDPKRPNCFEHYNPFNGKGSTYRGVDDYQHSWVNDLILKYLVGIDFEEDQLIIDPFPFHNHFSVRNLTIAGKELQVSWDGKSFVVVWEGKPFFESSCPTKVPIV